MSFTDWHSGHSVSAGKQPSTFVCTSTIEDFAYVPSSEEQTRDAAQKVATGRRSWKTVKGGSGEAVWSPQLEAALIEGLENYQPENTKATKCLGRFPMRNRFISDYIFQVTGKRRTPKQVGSRIQQLRDTCKGEHILRLISRNSASPDPSSHSHISDSHVPSDSPLPSPSSSSPPATQLGCSSTSMPHATKVRYVGHEIRVDIDLCSSPSRTPYIQLGGGATQRIRLTSTPVVSQHCRTARALASMEPSVMIFSLVQLWEQYNVLIYDSESRSLVHNETCTLKRCSSAQTSHQWVYQSVITEGFWKFLCYSQYPGQYLIQHSFKAVSPEFQTAPNLPVSEADDISVLYRFASEAHQPVYASALPSADNTMYFSGEEYGSTSGCASMDLGHAVFDEPHSAYVSSSSRSSGYYSQTFADPYQNHYGDHGPYNNHHVS